MGFPTPSVAHLMRNPGPEDLVYLSGGENREFEVADYPTLGKRMVRMGNQVDIYDAEDAQPFGPHVISREPAKRRIPMACAIPLTITSSPGRD